LVLRSTFKQLARLPALVLCFPPRSVPGAVGLNYLICMSHFAADCDAVPV
jgi:hypothetical protein